MGAPGGKDQALAVEGYLAKKSATAETYEVAGTLLPLDQVELKAETSGRLISLSVKDGAPIEKGTLIARIDDGELRAEEKQATAQLEYAKQNEQRIRTLSEKEGATVAELETAVATLRSAEASLEQIKAQLAKTDVYAPFAGTLGFLNVSKGAWMTSGASIATLSSVNRLKVEFALPQRYATSVRKGWTVTVSDEEQNLSAEGKIESLEPTLSDANRSRMIRAVIDNGKGKFLPGSFVKVKMSLEAPKEMSMPIPSEALTLDDAGAYLFVVKGGKAVQTRVKTGLRTSISVEVTSGLK
jgi:membrane fusion protein (multidrug efflux system)